MAFLLKWTLKTPAYYELGFFVDYCRDSPIDKSFVLSESDN